jgi:hypothetical protein
MNSGFVKVDWVMEGDPLEWKQMHQLKINTTSIEPSKANDLHVRVADIVYIRTWDSVRDMTDGILCRFGSIHSEVNDWAADGAKCGVENCAGLPGTCPLNAMAPFYEISVNGKGGALLQFMVHPEESERMQRIVAGTDNPMWDYVFQLQFNPDIGSHPATKRKKI